MNRKHKSIHSIEIFILIIYYCTSLITGARQMAQLSIDEYTNDLLDKLSKSRKENNKVIRTKKNIVEDLIIRTYKREVKE